MGKKQSPQEWKKHIEIQKLGMQTRVDYCREQGLTLSSFDYWSARIRKEQKGHVEKLIRIGVVDDLSRSVTGGPFVLHTGGGYRLEIPSPVNQVDVKMLVEILRACGC